MVTRKEIFITAHSQLSKLHVSRLDAHLSFFLPEDPVPVLSAAVDATITSIYYTNEDTIVRRREERERKMKHQNYHTI